MPRLTNPKLLLSYMRRADMTGARLGRSIGRSRQTVSQLVTGTLETCSDETADAIETALGLVPGTLFKPDGGVAVELPTRPAPVARPGSNVA